MRALCKDFLSIFSVRVVDTTWSPMCNWNSADVTRPTAAAMVGVSSAIGQLAGRPSPARPSRGEEIFGPTYSPARGRDVVVFNRGVAVALAAIHRGIERYGHPVCAQAPVERIVPLLPRAPHELVGGLCGGDQITVQQEQQGHERAHDGKVNPDDHREDRLANRLAHSHSSIMPNLALQSAGEVKHMKDAEADKVQCAEGGEPDKAEEPQVVAAADCVADEDAIVIELQHAAVRLAVM